MPKRKPIVTKAATKLTKKQEDFARAYVKTGNGSEAYKAAYKADVMSDQAIRVEASRLLDHPNVSLRIKALMAPGLRKAALDAEGTIAELAKVGAEKPEKGITYAEKISALGLLAKHYGLFEKDNAQRAENLALEIVLVRAKS